MFQGLIQICDDVVDILGFREAYRERGAKYTLASDIWSRKVLDQRVPPELLDSLLGEQHSERDNRSGSSCFSDELTRTRNESLAHSLYG